MIDKQRDCANLKFYVCRILIWYVLSNNSLEMYVLYLYAFWHKFHNIQHGHMNIFRQIKGVHISFGLQICSEVYSLRHCPTY